MRNCWVRDIADFAKYGLLRRLVGSDLRLGVIWYLTMHRPPNAAKTVYLSRADEYRACDEVLFETLKRIHLEHGDASTVRHVEQAGLFGTHTDFHNEPLMTTQLPINERREARAEWTARALSATAQASLVFLDPDTGLLRPSKKIEHRRSDEYATCEDVVSFLDRGQSVVVVQFGRPGNLEPAPGTARESLEMLAKATSAGGHPSPWGLWWKDVHKVGLLVAPTHDKEEVLWRRTADILEDPEWGRRFVRL